MSAVEVCPDCDIAGCTHIRNRTGAFAALSQPSVSDLMRQRANMKEALCEFAVSTGAKFDEVTLVEKEAHEGTKIRFEYSIQKKPPVEWPAQPSVSVELSSVAEVLEEAKDEGIGFWHTCSGCYEGVDGQNVHGYPYSDIFKCTLGAGCRECGGIGAIWDTTDYEDMASHLSTAKPVEPSASVERITRLAQDRAREVVRHITALQAPRRDTSGVELVSDNEVLQALLPSVWTDKNVAQFNEALQRLKRAGYIVVKAEQWIKKVRA